MNATVTERTNPPQPKRWRVLRRCLVGFAVFLTLICSYYTEELWRGKRAWENCKRELEVKGIKVAWTEDHPAPVPDDQNVFAAPEVQKWLLNDSNLYEEMADVANSNLLSRRLVMADVTVGPPGMVPPSGFVVLAYGDPQARLEAERLIKDVAGPTFVDPFLITHILRGAGEIHPAKIFLQCQTAPTVHELEQFFGDPVVPAWSVSLLEDEEEKTQIEPAGNDSYKVTVPAPSTVAEYLAWNAPLEPGFAVMHKLLRRPYARIARDPQDPDAGTFRILRNFSPVARMLAGMAQAHLLEGRPDEALRELTLIYDLGRIPEAQPVTGFSLLTLMVHLTTTSVANGAIADGLAWQAWREPQLVVLQEQLKEINFLPDWRQITLAMPAMSSQYFENATPSQLGEEIIGFRFGYPLETNARAKLAITLTGNLIPRGWIYQNMVKRAKFLEALIDSTDSAGQLIFPEKVEAITNTAGSHPSPYTFLAIKPFRAYSKNLFAIARVQTMVREAIIACALERCRLAQGAYPETLDALVPQFLDKIPHDVIGGQPPHYRRDGDGKFTLYSVGWSGRDGGGVAGATNTVGDWVWPNLY